MKNITVASEQNGIRLDKFLVDKLSEYSRSHIQKMIKQELIKVNNEVVTPHYFLKENDSISISSQELPRQVKVKKQAKEKVPEIQIIKDCPEYLVLNKPAGLIVHGTKQLIRYTLVDAILEKYPDLRQIGDDPDRPGIVHRLDKDVSGLMVLPRTQESFDNLKEQFQKRTVKKDYTALVYGQTTKDQDEINFPIQRSSQGYKMAALPARVKGKHNPEGKRALSEFSVKERFINYTLLSVNIKTGRTHQIRCHLSAYGHPVVGDDLYGTKRTREKNSKLNLSRVFLVANRLEFTDLNGERQVFEVELPENLSALLKQVK